MKNLRTLIASSKKITSVAQQLTKNIKRIEELIKIVKKLKHVIPQE